MAQFDVHYDRRSKQHPLLLDIQTDWLAGLSTRLVVPLVPRERYGAKPIVKRLNPMLIIEHAEYVARFQDLAAVMKSQLGSVITSLRARRVELIAAVDLLVTGA
jgi:toxin CcdB